MGRPSKLNHSQSHGYFSIVAGQKHYFGRDRTEARKKLIEVLHRNNKGERLDNPEIGSLVDDFLEHLKATVKDSTYQWYRYPLENFVAYMGRTRKLSSVSVADVQLWIAKNW